MSSDLTFASPESGRIFTRHLKEGRCLVGVLHFGQDVFIEEEKPYLLIMQDGKIALSRESAGGPEKISDGSFALGVDEALKSRIWQKTTNPNVWVARFYKAFPEQNGWSVFAPSSYPAETEDHALWLDIQKGTTKEINAPAKDTGYKMGQMLSTHPVWPNKEGELFVIPQMPSWTDELYIKMHKIMATAAGTQNSITRAEDILRFVPKMDLVSAHRADPMFSRFLHKMDAHLETPKSYGTTSAQDIKKDEEKAKNFIRSEQPDNSNVITLEKIEHKNFEQLAQNKQNFLAVCLLMDTLEELSGEKRRPVPKTQELQEKRKEEAQKREVIFNHQKIWDVLKNQNDHLEMLVPMCLLAARPDVLEKTLRATDWAQPDLPEKMMHWFKLSLLEKYCTKECSAVLARNWGGQKNHAKKCQKILLDKRDDLTAELIRNKEWVLEPDSVFLLANSMLAHTKNWGATADILEGWYESLGYKPLGQSERITPPQAIAENRTPVTFEDLDRLAPLGLDLSLRVSGKEKTWAEDLPNKAKTENSKIILAHHSQRLLKEQLKDSASRSKPQPLKKM